MQLSKKNLKFQKSNDKTFSLPVKFEDDNINNILDTELFFKLKLYYATIGKNLNSSSISKDVYEDAKETLEFKPILAYMQNVSLDNGDEQPDFTTHAMNYIPVLDAGGDMTDWKTQYLEQPVGFIPPSYMNNYHYELDEENGLTYAVVDAYIYKTYCQDAVDVLLKNQKQNISMEIRILDDEYDFNTNTLNVLKMKYLGITILSNLVSPGMEQARAEVVNYSQSTKDDRYCKMLEAFELSYANFKDNKTTKEIAIDNTKANAKDSSSWNPSKGKILNKLKEASNAKSLIEEMFAVHDLPNKIEDTIQDNVGYEHHSFKTINKKETMVVDIKGLQAAYARAKQQNLTGEPMAHINRHRKELGLDVEENKLKDNEVKINMEENKIENSEEFKKTKENEKAPESIKPEKMDDDEEMDDEEMAKAIKPTEKKQDDTTAGEVIDKETPKDVEKEAKKEKKMAKKPIKKIAKESETDEPDGDETQEPDGDESCKMSLEEFGKVISEKDEAYKVLTQKYEKVVSELEEIKSKYAEIEKEAKNKEIAKVFAKFSNKLTEAETKDLKENAMKFSIEELEDKLFALVGKKALTANFSISVEDNMDKSFNMAIDIPIAKEATKSEKPYADIVEKYRKK